MKTFEHIPVVILCGGKGSRMREDGEARPKPMVEIGGKPILWHIIQMYAFYGFRRFVLPLGFQGEVIRRYFSTAALPADYKITLIETGENTLKGGRIKRVGAHLTADCFHLTYGDGVSDVHLAKLHLFHTAHGKMATVTAVRPPSRFGELILRGAQVRHFIEKGQLSTGTINGGFFVFQKQFLDRLTAEESCDLEFGALQELAAEGELQAYRHRGFWQCMDTPRERDYLNQLWATKAPWPLPPERKTRDASKIALAK
jgi:glucose-1-phosphate cytidylyltransferase